MQRVDVIHEDLRALRDIFDCIRERRGAHLWHFLEADGVVLEDDILRVHFQRLKRRREEWDADPAWLAKVNFRARGPPAFF
jgi:hypothetical protein